MLNRIVVFGFSLVLAGCSWMPFFGSDDDKAPPDEETTEQILYGQAQRAIRSGNYQTAVTRLQRLEARFPFGRYAEQAQLELIYANYMGYELDAAVSAADRFIRLHPQHPSIDYAYYMRGLTAYTRDKGFFDRFFGVDESKRDVSNLKKAFADFSILVNRFPDSVYAKDARLRMIYLRNVLAQSEVNIANYYMSRNAYVAATNRARGVVEEYPQSEAVPDALAIMIEASWKLGLEEAANDALRVLAINYPHYDAFDDSGNLVLAERIRNRDRSWVNMMTFGLLDRPDVPPPLQIKHPKGFVPPTIDDTADEAKPKKPWYKRIPLLG